MSMSFVHLHCHSEYSLLDGANRIDDLIRRAQHFEMPALAITDHGNMHAAWEFQEKAKRAGIKPILGMEAYVAPGDRRQRGRSSPGARPYYHLVLLARDTVGYRNLVKLASLGYTEGFYTRPRIDRELLARYSEGLIVSSACLAGEVATHLMENRVDEAREAASWYSEQFRDRYFLEVQAHSSADQETLNTRIFSLAGTLDLPVIATNDAHFLMREDHDAHDVLLCIGLGRDRNDRDRMRYDKGLYFKSPEEISAFFPERGDVLTNTLAIADSVDVQFSKKYFVPSFPLPEGMTSENELLVQLATEGAHRRYGDPFSDEVRERLSYELDVITRMGYAGYFLIVADFIKAARDRGIPVGPGRGSAAGSLVAYALGITDVCPLEFDLLFERFLSQERVSMPDVDVDFCFERRGEVIEYVRQKYGRDSVGQIVTFGTMKSRAAIKDVGRTLGFTPAETDALAKLIPNASNFSLTVKEAIEKVPEVKAFHQNDVRYRQLLDYAIKLEGLSRHTGVHPAGVVIAPGPLDEFVPVCTQASKGTGSHGDDRVMVTQYDMTALEKAGMLKMDFLGLTTLTVISDALQVIRERTGHDVQLEKRGFTDPDTYRMLRTGRTAGVFQFESPLATDVLKRMRCDRFDDLVASNALVRPGPLDAGMHNVYIRRKLGEEPTSYLLPELETILSGTFGVITYQEQVMRIAQVLAGISLAEADVLRKAVGKKDAELIRRELGKFIEKSVARGYDPKIIDELATQIETFGRYGFNKSHSVAYSVIAYHTAFLKTHHPAEFMAALLSSSIGKTEDVIKYINHAREMEIEVLAPDVNESGWRFTVVGDKRIRFGLGAIRNVGRGAVDSLLSARENGPFSSLHDLCARVDLRLCNKRVFEALVAAGACDTWGGHRSQLLAGLDQAISAAVLSQEEAARGQGSLFEDPVGLDSGTSPGDSGQRIQALPNVSPWSESERLQREKELLGFYISGHPLESYRTECELFATHTVSQIGTWTAEPVTIGVVVTAIRKQISKRSGAEFARLTVEDFSGSSEVLVFAEAWGVISERIRQDVPLLLKGGYSRKDHGVENATFNVSDVTRFVELRASGEVAVAIDLASGSDLPSAVMTDVREVVESHEGSAPLEVRWRDGQGKQIRFRSRSLTVAASPAILSDLRALLGVHQVRLIRTDG